MAHVDDFHRERLCDPALILFALMLATLIFGCAPGPDFKRPEPPSVDAYTATPSPETTASAPVALGNAQQIGIGIDLPQQWWKQLCSPKLDALIKEALAASPSMAAARATLRQAQELYAAHAGSTQYPQVDAHLGAQRQRTNPISMGQTGDAQEFSLYNTNVGVRYQLDLAGGNRRALEALAARADYQRYQLDAARLMLAGNIAIAAITRARLAAQIEATEAIVQAQQQQVHVARDRLRIGQAAPDEEIFLKSQLETTRAQLPIWTQSMQQTEHLLALLSGRAPASGGIPPFTLSDFRLPPELPMMVPSELVRQRPDILAAEALMQAANAEYGVAEANLYPQIDLSANLGTQALTIGALFGSGSSVWSLVGQLTQPLFNKGLPAEKRAALAAFDAAAANYQSVVLEALRNVADVLRAVENDASRLVMLAAADEAARHSLRIIEARYRLGNADYEQILIAQQQVQRTRLELVAAQAQRLADSVALWQAMGRGDG